MAEFYTNLPPKQKDDLDKTIEKLTTSNYETEYQFNVGEYDSTVAFFVKRNLLIKNLIASETLSILSGMPFAVIELPLKNRVV